VTPLRVSIGSALLGAPAVLALELARRVGTLDHVLGWADDAVGAALLVATALHARSGRPAAIGLLALAWAFAAGQLLLSLLGQLGHAGPDPSGQPSWLVAAIKGALLAASAALALSTMKQALTPANGETGS